jgi:hypothetical protein
LDGVRFEDGHLVSWCGWWVGKHAGDLAYILRRQVSVLKRFFLLIAGIHPQAPGFRFLRPALSTYDFTHFFLGYFYQLTLARALPVD